MSSVKEGSERRVAQSPSSPPTTPRPPVRLSPTGTSFDICDNLYKRRGGWGKHSDNAWVLRCFTLHGEFFVLRSCLLVMIIIVWVCVRVRVCLCACVGVIVFSAHSDSLHFRFNAYL